MKQVIDNHAFDARSHKEIHADSSEGNPLTRGNIHSGPGIKPATFAPLLDSAQLICKIITIHKKTRSQNTVLEGRIVEREEKVVAGILGGLRR